MWNWNLGFDLKSPLSEQGWRFIINNVQHLRGEGGLELCDIPHKEFFCMKILWVWKSRFLVDVICDRPLVKVEKTFLVNVQIRQKITIILESGSQVCKIVGIFNYQFFILNTQTPLLFTNKLSNYSLNILK